MKQNDRKRRIAGGIIIALMLMMIQPCCPVSKAEEPITSVHFYGDVKLDGVIDDSDVANLNSLVIGEIEISDDLQFERADVNGDGELTKEDVDLVNEKVLGNLLYFPVEVPYGDVNGDQAIDISDKVGIRKYLLGQTNPEESVKEAMDLNGDGVCDDSDMELITQYILRTITVFPVQTMVKEIVIKQLPEKREYEVGEYICTTGLVVEAYYFNGYHRVVQDVLVQGSASAAGTKQVNISYTENGITRTTDYDIRVYEPGTVPTPEVSPLVTATPAITAMPTATPGGEPSSEPPAPPTLAPTVEPSTVPSSEPTAPPSTIPSSEPTAPPTLAPTVEPTKAPPTSEPTMWNCYAREQLFGQEGGTYELQGTYGSGSYINISKVERLTSADGKQYAFKHWVAEGVYLEQPYQASIRFVMPNNEVHLTAVYHEVAEKNDSTELPVTPIPSQAPSVVPQQTTTPMIVNPEIIQNENSNQNINEGITSAQELDAVKEGTIITQGSLVYKVLKNSGKDKTVMVVKAKNKKVKTITIPKVIKIKGESFKVVEIAKNACKGCKNLKKITIGTEVKVIGSNAFAKCKKLKTIVIKSKKLKKVGKKAFAGIGKKASIRVPKSKVKAYRKLLK